MYSNEIIMLHEILFNTANIFSLLFVVTIEIRPNYKNIFNLITNRIMETLSSIYYKGYFPDQFGLSIYKSMISRHQPSSEEI